MATSAQGTPRAEFPIDAAFVQELLRDQYPDLTHVPIRPVESGWDNVLFRLGDDMAVRLPIRQATAALIVHEQTWLPQLAPQLTLPIPIPIRVGKPALGYPWHWSIVPWLGGMPADLHEPRADQAAVLATFLRSLHAPAPADAPVSPVRGVPISRRADSLEPRLQRLVSRDLIAPQVLQIWQEALQTPVDVAATWLHGDLHPRNVLVERGEITGIIDWGDMTSGDCATDLASIWMLFGDPAARAMALATYGLISDATVRRAKGWAVLLGVTLLETGLIDNPRNAALGERILRHVAAG